MLALIVLSFTINQNWSIEPGSKVTFSIGYWAGTCNGTIGGIKGNINFDAEDLSKSFFNIGFDVNTINSNNNLRDNHIKKEDYFDAAKFPIILFKSTAITKSTSGYIVEGNLTIKSTTKKIQIPFTFKENATGAVFTGNFKINRIDYTVGESSWKLKDEVIITVLVPVKKI